MSSPAASAVPVRRLNHAVLYVRDLDRSSAFYQQAFGFEEIAREGGMMAFLRAGGSENQRPLQRPSASCPPVVTGLAMTAGSIPL